jgi:hypothetical protein
MSYITLDIFQEYLTIIFLKYITTTRELMNLPNSPIFILYDNCTIYINTEIMILLTWNNVLQNVPHIREYRKTEHVSGNSVKVEKLFTQHTLCW